LDSQLDQTQIIKNLSADSEKFTHAGKMVKSVSLWRSRSAKGNFMGIFASLSRS
jgi:hypothetical protein